MHYDYGNNKRKTISLRITSDMFDSVNVIATNYGLSVSEFLRLLIEAYVNTVEKEGV